MTACVAPSIATSPEASASPSGRTWETSIARVLGAVSMIASGLSARPRASVTKRYFDTSELPSATAEYETYWFWHLPGTSADLWYSRSWMGVARSTHEAAVWQQAMAISEQSAARATDNAEEPFAAWYNLAQISALLDNYLATESSLRRAIDSHPNWFKPHWMLARQLRLESRLDEARKEAALAAELDAGHHPEVAGK